MNDWHDLVLYVMSGLLILTVIAKIAAPFNPLTDSIYFSTAELNGRRCIDMADEAKARGAKRWVCWVGRAQSPPEGE